MTTKQYTAEDFANAEATRHLADWLIDHASSDVEDCEACLVYAEGGGNGYCPVHYGVAQGVDATLSAVRQKVGELE